MTKLKLCSSKDFSNAHSANFALLSVEADRRYARTVRILDMLFVAGMIFLVSFTTTVVVLS